MIWWIAGGAIGLGFISAFVGYQIGYACAYDDQEVDHYG
jgi:hypothetical protein